MRFTKEKRRQNKLALWRPESLGAVALLCICTGAAFAQANRQSLPTPSSDLGNLTVVGVKIYYGDDSVDAFKLSGNGFNRWRKAVATGVQAVKVFFEQTYRTWHSTADAHASETQCNADTFYPDRDRQRPGHCAVLNYAHIFYGADVYWWDGADDWGAGLVTDVPVQLPADGSKTGTLISDADFVRIYNTAKDDHVAP